MLVPFFQMGKYCTGSSSKGAPVETGQLEISPIKNGPHQFVELPGKASFLMPRIDETDRTPLAEVRVG